MKKEEKIQPSAWHQHISNDSQAEKICGRWSKVANLWKAPFNGITKDKKIDKGLKNKDTNKRQNKENKKNDSQTAYVGSLVMMLVLHVWPTCQRHLLWYFDTVEILTIDLGSTNLSVLTMRDFRCHEADSPTKSTVCIKIKDNLNIQNFCFTCAYSHWWVF